MIIQYVSKEQLHPAFGRAWPASSLIEVRDDLPKRVREFIIEHEKYHLTDPAKWWAWREIKANAYAARRRPWGALHTLWLTITSFDRWKFYFTRVKENR